MKALIYHGGIRVNGYRWVVYRDGQPPGVAEGASDETFDTPEAAQADYQRHRAPLWPESATWV
jgi:hypothetical protein